MASRSLVSWSLTLLYLTAIATALAVGSVGDQALAVLPGAALLARHVARRHRPHTERL
jgi:hypothetical protein